MMRLLPGPRRRGCIHALVLLSVLPLFWGCASRTPRRDQANEPYVLVLGIAQDGGLPQAGCNQPHCERAWNDISMRRSVASLAIVDPLTRERWMIDATPDFALQLRRLDQAAPRHPNGVLQGIFLTHAHIGHYTGLMHLGREVMGARGVPVYAMPRMAGFLRTSGPWEQLVTLGNIEIRPLAQATAVPLNPRISITPLLVPHRDEYSETAGFIVRGPSGSLLYIPDIDKWERWETAIESLIRNVDIALLDGTFYAEGELPGRSMAEIPHPFIVETLARTAPLNASERAKVRFIHLNHTNPALDPKSEARREIERAGAGVAGEGERLGL